MATFGRQLPPWFGKQGAPPVDPSIMGMLPQAPQGPEWTAGAQVAPPVQAPAQGPLVADPAGISREGVMRDRMAADAFGDGPSLENVRDPWTALAYTLQKGIGAWAEKDAKLSEEKLKASDRKALAEVLNKIHRGEADMSALGQLDNPAAQDWYAQAMLGQMTKAPAERWEGVDIDGDGKNDFQKSSITGEHKDMPKTLAEEEKLRRAGAANNTTNVNMGGSEKQMYDTIEKSYERVAPVVAGLNSLREAEKLIDAGGVFGPGAELRIGAAKLISLLTGAPVGKGVVNAESFKAAIAPLVGATLKATSGTSQLSEGELRFAQAAAAGDISLDPQSIKKILGILKKAQVNSAMSHNKKLDTLYPKGKGFERERGLFEIDVKERGVDKQGRPISRLPDGQWEYED